MNLPARKKERKKAVSNRKMINKVCIACGEMASSNAQPKCKSCGAMFTKKEKGSKPSKSAERVKIQAPLPNKAGDKNYTITVDFSPYPTLHESLVNMAKEEIRRPEDQLLFLLKNELAEKEKAIGQ